MTIYELQETLRQKVWEMARSTFGIDLGQIVSEIPPKIELGDAAFPAAFELAKLIKQKTGEKSNPREIAETLKAELEKFDFVDHIEVAGPGYLNVFFDRVKFHWRKCRLAASAQAITIRIRSLAEDMRRAYVG